MTPFFAEFVHTVNGVTCSDYGLMDLAHPQECSAAVDHAKSFNDKSIFMSRTDHEDRHKGCFIYDSGAMWFNTHDTGSRSSYVTSICKIGNTQFWAHYSVLKDYCYRCVKCIRCSIKTYFRMSKFWWIEGILPHSWWLLDWRPYITGEKNDDGMCKFMHAELRCH